MVVTLTKLKILDNTGASLGRCLMVYRRKEASVGDKVILSVIKLRVAEGRLKKGILFKALIIVRKSMTKRITGFFFKGNVNGAILLARKDASLVGSRVKAYVPYDLRVKGFLRVLLISRGVY